MGPYTLIYLLLSRAHDGGWISSARTALAYNGTGAIPLAWRLVLFFFLEFFRSSAENTPFSACLGGLESASCGLIGWMSLSRVGGGPGILGFQDGFRSGSPSFPWFLAPRLVYACSTWTRPFCRNAYPYVCRAWSVDGVGGREESVQCLGQLGVSDGPYEGARGFEIDE